MIPTATLFAAASSGAIGPKAEKPPLASGGGSAILWLLWGGVWTLIRAAFAINHTLKERRKTA